MGSTTNNTLNNVASKEENTENQNSEVDDLEWSADQEILLLYSLHGFKPVGPNKHFRMLLIQDRLSSAMNKRVSSLAIWKKLNTLYDLEALDEAEAEADALVAVETDFSLPEDEFGELMASKLKQQIKIEKSDSDNVNSSYERIEAITDVRAEIDSLEDDDTYKPSADTVKYTPVGKEVKKDSVKKGPKKKDQTPVRDNSPLKKDNAKETPKKDTPNKKDNAKEAKKIITRDDDKKDFGKKPIYESKKEITKEDKKEPVAKANKKENIEKRLSDQMKKDAEVKKADQRKIVETPKSQRAEGVKTRPETPKQLRADSAKRINQAEMKTPKTETIKTQRNETTTKLQRVETLKKENSDKKKETSDKKNVERKSPEKSVESARGAKLRTREKKEESDKTETPTGTKRERSRDAMAKAIEAVEEPPAKKAKTPVTKGRPTRNSIEPQKPASPAVNPPSPQKRRTRVL
ncbi:chromatin modification-related protein EAF7 [Homalodisca vitripennis]|uniref:chromatin modification-related protein EAF7 n=1 Tax=Homalodisca vitripennis TaxID=197043 RepID=UPI001EEAE190|nr:chromatin modification-related protein EAF7 [Homalodisca vitripennis]